MFAIENPQRPRVVVVRFMNILFISPTNMWYDISHHDTRDQD